MMLPLNRDDGVAVSSYEENVVETCCNKNKLVIVARAVTNSPKQYGDVMRNVTYQHVFPIV